jgi:hypothetical protein
MYGEFSQEAGFVWEAAHALGEDVACRVLTCGRLPLPEAKPINYPRAFDDLFNRGSPPVYTGPECGKAFLITVNPGGRRSHAGSDYSRQCSR